jgi:hypothetical protein
MLNDWWAFKNLAEGQKDNMIISSGTPPMAVRL